MLWCFVVSIFQLSTEPSGAVNRVTEGLVNGVLEGAVSGVMEGMADEVMEGAVNEVMEGVVDGVLEGAVDGMNFKNPLPSVVVGDAAHILADQVGAVDGGRDDFQEPTFFSGVRRRCSFFG